MRRLTGLGVLRAALLLLTVACAILVAAWGYLGAFTDTLVLRQSPLMTSVSPDGRWELRVYEVAPGSRAEEATGQWLATLRPLGQPDTRERVVFRGHVASFVWGAPNKLGVREHLTGQERLVDASSAREVGRFEGDHGHGFAVIIAYAALAPALVILAVGTAASIFVPRALHRRRRTALRAAEP